MSLLIAQAAGCQCWKADDSVVTLLLQLLLCESTMLNFPDKHLVPHFKGDVFMLLVIVLFVGSLAFGDVFLHLLLNDSL